jgi:uncharacterized protein (TIGR02284 family)
MKNEKTIEVLNTLVQINNDRIEGYETASEETKEQDLKTFFAELKRTSLKCNQELTGEIVKSGGTATDSTKTTGKFFRVWMDVKVALTSDDRKAILNSCEYGEDVAKKTYENVLEDEAAHLNTEQKVMIKAQHALLKADHDKVKSMRDQLVEQD